MSFTSLTFLVFFAIVLAVYWLLRRRQWQNLFLLVASFTFYGWLTPWYTLLLAGSILVDYLLGLAIARWPGRGRFFLGCSILINLGVLGFFKYFNFFSTSVAAGLNSMGIQVDAPVLSLLLPLGISFFTLKKISAMIETANGLLPPVRSLVDFALYVAFFPQLIAGPIDRPRQLLPQIQADRKWQASHFTTAWPLIAMGLFKKLVIADTIKVMVDKVFILSMPGKLLLLCGGLAFALQILADFSAYTDISRGLASLLGFKTSQNFRAPYFSLTPTDFWNRWHITLSHWLRDTIFFPLRRALLKRGFGADSLQTLLLPPLLTMLVSGLWHGAGWNFILWGLYYGVLIVVYQRLGLGGSWKPASLPGWALAWGVMFFWITLGWIIFRSPSLSWLADSLFLAPLLSSAAEGAVALVVVSSVVYYGFLMLVPHLLMHLPDRWRWLETVYLAAAMVMTIIYTNSAPPDFIYFQF